MMFSLKQYIFGKFKRIDTLPLNYDHLQYSWILSNHLAVGPMPRIPEHWDQLTQAGFKGRFSCCYDHENIFAPIPNGWKSAEVSLPDHRNQEKLSVSHLLMAIECAEELLFQDGTPLYLHCFAGRERSPLLAVGLTARLRKIDLFAALAWVRQCHPNALPIYEHLEVMEALLASNTKSQKY
jgi:hypothetical protein